MPWTGPGITNDEVKALENTRTWDSVMLHSMCLKILGSMGPGRKMRLLDGLSPQARKADGDVLALLRADGDALALLRADRAVPEPPPASPTELKLLQADGDALERLTADRAAMKGLEAQPALERLTADRAALELLQADQIALELLRTDQPARERLRADRAALERLKEIQAALERLETDRAALELLQAYIRFSIEMAGNPRKYDNFEAICSAVYCRLIVRSMDEFRVTVMYEALFNQSERYYRFGRRESHLSQDEIARLWQPNPRRRYAVEASGERRLWENMLLSWDGDTSMAGRDPTLERKMFAWLWRCLEPGDRENAAAKLTEPEKRRLTELDENWPDREEQAAEAGPAPDKPCGLFEKIDRYRRKNGIKATSLYELFGSDEMGRTYLSWKKKWKECEANGFRTLPKTRLSRQNIIDISLFFHLTIPQACELMMMAGYAFNDGDEDILRQLGKNGSSADQTGPSHNDRHRESTEGADTAYE